MNDKQKAASAAFTFLVDNPDDKMMAKNLKYYSGLPEVDIKDVINFEAKVQTFIIIVIQFIGSIKLSFQTNFARKLEIE